MGASIKRELSHEENIKRKKVSKITRSCAPKRMSTKGSGCACTRGMGVTEVSKLVTYFVIILPIVRSDHFL